MATKSSTPPPPPPPPTPSSFLEKAQTIPEALRHHANHQPNKAAFVFRAPNSAERHVLTFRDLYQLGGCWASRLHSRGVGRGQRVVDTLPNSPERAIVDSAILLSGAACVNGVCQMQDASDLKTLLKRSAATALVLDPDFMPDVYAALLRDVITKPQPDGRVTSQSLPELKFVFLVRRGREGSDDDFVTSLKKDAAGEEVFYEEEAKGEDVCMVFTTSGSSGFPKLVVFPHKTLVVMGRSLKRPPDSVEFSVSLLGWVSGFFGNILLTGTTRVLCDARAGLPEDFAAFIFQSVKEEGVTNGSVPIHLLPDLAQKVEALNNGQPILPMMGLGAQPITKAIVKEAAKVARMFVAGYAGTEMLFVSAAFPVDVGTFQDYFMGKPVPGIEVKVCSDDDQGQEVKANTRGQILVKSPYMFREYLHDPHSTSAAFTEDGFFRTGDVGWLDSQGCLYVEGRSGDVIMRGRRVVYPGPLESLLRNCPAVRDVMVVGVPDVMLQNELCACVVLEAGEWGVEDVEGYVGRVMREDTTDSQSCRPRYYLAMQAFPLTPTGKPLRAQVKERAERMMRDQQHQQQGPAASATGTSSISNRDQQHQQH